MPRRRGALPAPRSPSSPRPRAPGELPARRLSFSMKSGSPRSGDDASIISVFPGSAAGPWLDQHFCAPSLIDLPMLVTPLLRQGPPPGALSLGPALWCVRHSFQDVPAISMVAIWKPRHTPRYGISSLAYLAVIICCRCLCCRIRQVSIFRRSSTAPWLCRPSPPSLNRRNSTRSSSPAPPR